MNLFSLHVDVKAGLPEVAKEIAFISKNVAEAKHDLAAHERALGEVERRARALCSMIASIDQISEADVLNNIGLSPIEPPKPTALKRGQEA